MYSTYKRGHCLDNSVNSVDTCSCLDAFQRAFVYCSHEICVYVKWNLISQFSRKCVWLPNDVLVFIPTFDKKYNGTNRRVSSWSHINILRILCKKKPGKGMEWVMCIHSIDPFKSVLANSSIFYCYNQKFLCHLSNNISLIWMYAAVDRLIPNVQNIDCYIGYSTVLLIFKICLNFHWQQQIRHK